ncbi:hypothetical protein [Xinfangfangia pollutisoli]|uniref:hypothetical protein n=1 Tax=Xinfangfangia pollutisoli TaxID=2865960 RepID=UPI001CD4728B|nr:hypothetical protein [Xinfangfangia pollutisoli]
MDKTLVRSLACLAAFSASPGLAQDRDIYLTMTGIRSATTAPGGLAFISGSWSSDRVNSAGGSGLIDRTDGSMSFGAGFGSAETGIGVQLTATITSLSDDFADSGYLGVKFSRRISAEGQVPVYLGVAVDSLGAWGDSSQNEETADLILSAFPVIQTASGPKPLMVTVGYGSHTRDYGTAPGAYFGVGLGLTRNFAVSAAWNGDEAILGTGFRFDALPNMHFTASIDDVFDQNDTRRLTLQATWTTDKLFGGGF